MLQLGRHILIGQVEDAQLLAPCCVKMMNLAMRCQQQMMPTNINNNITPTGGLPMQQSAAAATGPASLLRSKSLNDISIDSQISAFASDRFINLPINNNSGGDEASNRVCMEEEACYIYQQQSHNLAPIDSSNGTGSNTYGHAPFGLSSQHHQQQNLNNNSNNQCSRPSSNNVFSNLCSPLATLTTLNGVTEQIGNLHL